MNVYEAHMTHVAQLQELNAIMKAQWQALPEASKAAVLGIAGGNGLEYAGDSLRVIYGIDLNPEYLQACNERYGRQFGERLKLLELDLTEPGASLPETDLIIADLLIEYVGLVDFCRLAAQSQAKLASCVIQQQSPREAFVSSSPYQAQFQNIGRLHQDIDSVQLTEAFAEYGYVLALEDSVQLPTGKALVRLDYRRL